MQPNTPTASLLHPESILYKDVQYVKRIKKNALNQIRHKRHLYQNYQQYEKAKMLDFLSNFILPLQNETIQFSNGFEISSNNNTTSLPSHFSIFEPIPQQLVQNGVIHLLEKANIQLQNIFEKSEFIEKLKSMESETKKSEEEKNEQEFEYDDTSDSETK